MNNRSSHTRGRRSFSNHLLDYLEPRTLLSGTHGKPGGSFDLAPTALTAPSLHAALLTGLADKGSLSVTIANNGTGASTNASLSVFLRPAGTDGSADINITPRAAKVGRINAGASKNVSVKLSLPASLAAGDYTLVVTVTDSSADTDATNNTLVSSQQLTDAAGSVSLAGTLALKGISTSIAAGTKDSGVVLLRVSNTGNIRSTKTTLNVSILLHPAAGSDVTLTTRPHIPLPPLKPSSTRAVSVPLPTSIPADVPAGTYTIVVTITPVSGNAGPLTLTSDPITITAPTSTSPILEHGDTLAFTADTNLNGGTANFLETGSFITDQNVQGTYQLTATTLTLTYSATDIQTLPVTFINGPTLIDDAATAGSTSVTISLDPTNALLSFADPLDATQTAYLRLA